MELIKNRKTKQLIAGEHIEAIERMAELEADGHISSGSIRTLAYPFISSHLMVMARARNGAADGPPAA